MDAAAGAGGRRGSDLPGFGRHDQRGDFPFSYRGLRRWLDRFAEHAGLDRFSLVVHDWGGLALAWAARHAERVERRP